MGSEDSFTTKKKKRRAVIPDKDLLKTGCTLLDLAISDRRAGGFFKGHYFWMCGNSSSGKTFLMLTCLAEASINSEFNKYRFIYDNVEDGALMDFRRYFGPRMAKRLEAPSYDNNGKPKHSREIEDFYFNLDDAFAEAEKPGGKPFIYLLDSMDALDSKYSEAKFQEAKKASGKGTTAKGNYGDGKAKINSTHLRKMVGRLPRTGSILIVLSQLRDNINAGPFDEQQVVSGGHVLTYAAAVQLWSSVGRKIKKTIQDRKVVVGVYCRVTTRKNRRNGKVRTIEFPIYYDTGIDDIGGMVDFLTYWKVWPKNKSGVIDTSADFDDAAMRREDLIHWIEENDLRNDLEEIVEAAWKDVESQAAVERENKYK